MCVCVCGGCTGIRVWGEMRALQMKDREGGDDDDDDDDEGSENYYRGQGLMVYAKGRIGKIDSDFHAESCRSAMLPSRVCVCTMCNKGTVRNRMQPYAFYARTSWPSDFVCKSRDDLQISKPNLRSVVN